MDKFGNITPDEFDVVYRIVEDKRMQYEQALEEFMFATRHNKGKYVKGQTDYWNHCISTCKDILSYARNMIRISADGGATIQQFRPDSCERSSDENGRQSGLWPDE